ncbi:MAG: hypothetical protein ABR999_08980 [Methanoregula sp.]|uniref:hypothetical protein n=1 Tax=Methanoregula sp. TaxID=2052170 RepID=UPI003D11F571
MTDGRTFLVLNYCMGEECKRYPCGHVKDWMKRHGVERKSQPHTRPVIQEVSIGDHGIEQCREPPLRRAGVGP